MSAREALLRNFLAEAGWAEAERSVLAADASFRRYDRLAGPAGRAVLMDAPPEHEKPASFVRLARLLTGLGLSAPRILAADLERGFVLLEDLGDDTFTRALAAGRDEASLYRLGVDTLIALQRAWRPELGAGIAPYDAQALLAEAELLTAWYLPAVTGRETPADALESYRAAWRAVLPLAGRLPPTLVLRDYHVDNLMVLEGRRWRRGCSPVSAMPCPNSTDPPSRPATGCSAPSAAARSSASSPASAGATASRATWSTCRASGAGWRRN
jgi:aminoglycoside/choline kinase family phosphotransferase